MGCNVANPKPQKVCKNKRWAKWTCYLALLLWFSNVAVIFYSYWRENPVNLEDFSRVNDLVVKFECLVVKIGNLVVIIRGLVVKIAGLVVKVK